MKRLFIPLIVFSLSACSSNQILQALPVVGNVCTAAQGTLIDEKVVYAAEVIYNIPAQAYKAANENGKLSPELKGRLKPLLIKMNDLRLTISAAKGTVNCDFAQMKELQVQVLQLLPRN